MSVCVCARTHAYKQEWTLNVFVLSVVCAEDEIQMMLTLIEILCSDEGKPRLEAIYAEVT